MRSCPEATIEDCAFQQIRAVACVAASAFRPVTGRTPVDETHV